MRIGVVGAGVGGLAAAVRLAAAGHDVTVVEAAPLPGGKCARLRLEGLDFDAGPSLLTMPWVLSELLAAAGSRIEDELELLRVEPVTRYRFADASELELSADLPRALESLDRWSPAAAADWVRFLGVCAGMWRASVPFLSGPAPWPPSGAALRGGARRPRTARQDSPGVRPDPRDLVRVRPWSTLSGLARSVISDPRLCAVVERFATYAGADPRRAPAALAVAGYVEHAFGAWHVRGGLFEIVAALQRRLAALGGELRLQEPVRAIAVRSGAVSGLETDRDFLPCEAVVSGADAMTLHRDLLPPRGHGGAIRRRVPATGSERHRAVDSERSLSGFALMLVLRRGGGAAGTPRRALAHHTILFPASTHREFDDVFSARRPVADPTLYVSAPGASEGVPDGGDREGLFVLANAPTHGGGVDWDREAVAYERLVLDRLAQRGLDVRDRVLASARRTPADLERETGSPGGAIYGAAPHGRLAALRRPPNVSRSVRGLYLVGGTAHPGGGLPLVMLSARIVAEAIGPAR